MTMTAQFRHDVIINCFVFLSSLVTGPSFMSISLLVLELWQFSFIRDWPEIWKSEIHPVSGDWSMMKMPNFANFSNKMLLNVAKYQGYSIYHFWVTKGKKRDILIVSLSFSFSLLQINLIMLPYLDWRLISFGEKQWHKTVRIRLPKKCLTR